MDNQIFICKICLAHYDKKIKIPKMLSCGHTFCNECLTKIIKKPNHSCSYCKKEVDKNFTPIINYDILSNLPESNLKEKLCIHHNEEIHLFCKTCLKDICQKCLIEGHLTHQLTKSCITELTNLKNDLKDVDNLKANLTELIDKNNKNAIDSFEEYSKVIRYMLNCIISVNSNDNLKLADIEKKSVLIKKAISEIEKNPDNSKNYNLNDLQLKEDEKTLYTDLTKDKSLEIRSFNYFFDKYTFKNAFKLFKKAFIESNNMESPDNNLLYIPVEKENKTMFDTIRNNSPLKMSENLFRILITTDRKDFLDNKFCKLDFYGIREEYIRFNTYIPDPTFHFQTLYYLDYYLLNKDSSKLRKALDIGSGSGFMTLCISKLLGPNSVTFGMDHIVELVKFSEENVNKNHLNYTTEKKLKFIIGNALDGYPMGAQYDIIHFGIAHNEIPVSAKIQLAVGGIIFIPTGEKNEDKKVLIIRKIAENKFENFELFKVKGYNLMTKIEQLKGFK